MENYSSSKDDFFLQALSQIALGQTGVGKRLAGDALAKSGKLRIDVRELLGVMNQLKETAKAEEEILKPLPHLSLIYGRDLLRPESHQAAVDKVADFLNLCPAPAKTNYLKVLPNQLSDFVENVDEVIRAVRETEFKEFLFDPRYEDLHSK